MTVINIRDILTFLENSGYSVHYQGAEDISVTDYCQADSLKSGSITWIKNAAAEKVYDFSPMRTGIVVTDKAVACQGDHIGLIVTNSPKAVFFSVLNHFFDDSAVPEKTGIHTVIGDAVRIGKDVVIGNNCSIVGDIVIGDHTVISDNVVIKNRVSIGSNCVIHALTVIGEDGFGYFEREDDRKVMIRHHGGVSIGNDVFIDSHVNIARGTMGDTIIEDGVRISPSTVIAHNDHIEKNATVICSQLYGSVHLGSNAYVVGSIVKNQCSVGSNTMVGMGSVVTKDIGDGEVAVGVPAKVIRKREEQSGTGKA